MDCLFEIKFYASKGLVSSFMCYQSQQIIFYCIIVIALRWDNPISTKIDGQTLLPSPFTDRNVRNRWQEFNKVFVSCALKYLGFYVLLSIWQVWQ